MAEPIDSMRHPFLEALAKGWQPHTHVRGPLVVAVSGGGDSVALLRGLHQLLAEQTPPSGQRLVVAHARHDLRVGHPGDPAAADADFAQRLADELGLPCVERFLGVREAVAGGEGLEAAARRLRYAFLREAAEETGARLVVTAHTADDQAETVLHRLLRGTGLAGMAGIAPARSLVEGIAVVRPLLAVSAGMARDYLRVLGQEWREDATNRDVQYSRNFLRHQILPQLTGSAYPAARESLLRLASHATATHDTQRAACEALLAAYAHSDGQGQVFLRVDPLSTWPAALLADVLAHLWRQQAWPLRDMTSRHYANLAGMCERHAESSTARLDLPGGIRAEVVESGHLRIGPSGIKPLPDPPPRP
jgi:tRNA(Ile)-lysidine synthase